RRPSTAPTTTSVRAGSPVAQRSCGAAWRPQASPRQPISVRRYGLFVTTSALAITEEHRDLADAAIGALTRLGSLAAARASLDGGSSHPAEIWKTSAELGWHGLAIAEEHGGSGFGLSELAIILEAQGHELCPGPFLPTVTAALVIDRCGTESLRAELLPGLA